MTGRENLIGYVNGRPVWLFTGADDPMVEPDDEGDSDNQEPEWAPPTREEWERLQAASKRNSKEAADRRKYLQEHGIDPRTGKKLAADDDPAPTPTATPQAPALDKAAIKAAVDSAVTKAVAATELKYRPALERHAVKATLDASGCDPAFRDLIAKSLDLSNLDYDEDGNAIGLDDQITALKVQYPQVFKKAATAAPRRTGGAAAVDGGQKQPPPPAKKGWMSQLDDQMNA